MKRGSASYIFMLGLLVLAAGISVAMRYGKAVPLKKDLAQFPLVIGDWKGQDTGQFPESVLKILNATDYVSRVYTRDRVQISFFIGFYGEQRAGESMHSPKNCLPGGGWEVLESRRVPLEIPAAHRTIEVNHYLLQNDQARQFVLYWYDTHGRSFASEYQGKFILVWEALRTGKTDGSLIRILVPFGGTDATPAEAVATDFARQIYPLLREYLPD